MKRVFKFFCFSLILLIIFLFYNNYIMFSNLKISNLFNNYFLLFRNIDSSDVVSLNNSDIVNNESIIFSDEDAKGVFAENYELKIDNLDISDFKILSIHSNNFSDDFNFSVELFSDGDVYSYEFADFLVIDADKVILMADYKNIDKIIIKAVKEYYVNAKTIDFSINSIDINNRNDFKILRKKLFYKNILLAVFIAVICLVYFILKKTRKYYKNKEDRIPRMFLIVSICCGTVFSILFPLYQVPDELSHINMLYSELGVDVDFYDKTNQYGDTIRIVHNASEKINVDEYFDFSKKLFTIDKYSIPKITIIKHFPQAIGLIISEQLHFPIILSVFFAEFMAVIFYSFCCYYALKLVPFKKQAMMAVMLLPICIQQMSSFSYDVVLLSMYFLFISYFLYLKFLKNKIFLSDILKLVSLIVVISVIKVPYILIVFLFMMLPLSKLNINFGFFTIDYDYIKGNKKLFVSILIILCVLCFGGILLISERVYFVRVFLAAILFPEKSLPLLIRTVSLNKFGYLRGFTSEFGWLDTHSSFLYTSFSCISILIISFINFDNKKNSIAVKECPFKKSEIFSFYFIACLMLLSIILSMFDWSAVIMGYGNLKHCTVFELANIMAKMPHIAGVQSRYFIPVIPLLIIPLFNCKISKFLLRFNLTLFLVLYYFVMISYFFILILNRYWI